MTDTNQALQGKETAGEGEEKNETIPKIAKDLEGPDLAFVMSNLDKLLYFSQKKYEATVTDLAIARDFHTDKKLKYDLAFADFVRDNKEVGTITVLKEIALSACKNEYKEHLEAESYVKKLQDGLSMWGERLNTLKALSKLNLGNTRG